MSVSDFYKPVLIPKLASIQQQALKLIPEKLLGYTNLTYIENSKEIFLSIAELSEFLKSKKVYESVGSIAVNVTIGQGAGNFHKDSGPYKHSLNIPIIGCNDTYINFFKVNSDYKVVNVEDQGRTHRFFRYTTQHEPCDQSTNHFPCLIQAAMRERQSNLSFELPLQSGAFALNQSPVQSHRFQEPVLASAMTTARPWPQEPDQH